ncbi:MAG: hypothetical protein QOJ17_1574, partial [Rhodospirillaceae bacterium]|nr:hypothetical protein [Rhodospirillaceae bacterium]
ELGDIGSLAIKGLSRSLVVSNVVALKSGQHQQAI